MRDHPLILPALLTLAWVAFSGGGARADVVKGCVRDRGKQPPGNGLSAAKVQLRRPDKTLIPSDPVLSNADGEYQVPDVPKGDYTLVVVKVGYIARPDETTKVKVDGDTSAADVILQQEHGSDEYYAVIADDILKKVAAAPKDQQRKVLTSQWDSLRAINLPPSSKARLARQLDKKDAAAKDLLPDLKPYLEAKPETIQKAEEQFDKALMGKGTMPTNDSLKDLNLGPDIVADMVLFHVKGTSESKTKRDAFVKDFLLRWDETPASKRYKDFQKQGLDKRSMIAIPPG